MTDDRHGPHSMKLILYESIPLYCIHMKETESQTLTRSCAPKRDQVTDKFTSSHVPKLDSSIITTGDGEFAIKLKACHCRLVALLPMEGVQTLTCHDVPNLNETHQKTGCHYREQRRKDRRRSETRPTVAREVTSRIIIITTEPFLDDNVKQRTCLFWPAQIQDDMETRGQQNTCGLTLTVESAFPDTRVLPDSSMPLVKLW